MIDADLPVNGPSEPEPEPTPTGAAEDTPAKKAAARKAAARKATPRKATAKRAASATATAVQEAVALATASCTAVAVALAARLAVALRGVALRAAALRAAAFLAGVSSAAPVGVGSGSGSDGPLTGRSASIMSAHQPLDRAERDRQPVGPMPRFIHHFVYRLVELERPQQCGLLAGVAATALGIAVTERLAVALCPFVRPVGQPGRV